MKFSFLNYTELEKDQHVKQEHFDFIKEKLLTRLKMINKNPSITDDLIEKNLDIQREDTRIRFFTTKEFITIGFQIKFFDIDFQLPVAIYFNGEGKQVSWHSTYRESSSKPALMNLLNINHFQDGNAHLEFSLEDEYHDEIYEIVKEECLKTPLYPVKRVTLKYSFDKNHKVRYRNFQSRDTKTLCTSGYSHEGFEKFETEIMFLKFLNHIMTERENVDPDFIDYKNINFEDSKWMKQAYTMFFNKLTGDKRTAFLDYLNLIDMMVI